MQTVTATGLAPVLDDEGARFTVFAPNDRAFVRLVTDLTGSAPASERAALETAVSALGVDAIKNVLLYHVVARRKLRLRRRAPGTEAAIPGVRPPRAPPPDEMAACDP